MKFSCIIRATTDHSAAVICATVDADHPALAVIKALKLSAVDYPDHRLAPLWVFDGEHLPDSSWGGEWNEQNRQLPEERR